MDNISLPGVPSFTWQPPVLNPGLLPTEGNQLGDARAVLSLNDIFMFDGSSWVSVAAGGTVTAVTASAPMASSGGSAPNLSIPKSDATHDGYLAQADFSTFNGKQSALTFGNLSDAGTDGIVVTGGTGAVIGSGTSIAQQASDATHNGYLSSADFSTFAAKQNALTFGDLTDAGTDGIVVTGGTGAVIGSGTSIAQQASDSTHNGYLSSVDWSTFNAKQSASYTPGDSGDWDNPQPTTIQEAIDRIAAVVGGVVPIP